MTSRTLPYQAAAEWQLQAEDGWAVRTLQPFAFGQVRGFLQAWYAALAQEDDALDASAASTSLAGQLAASLGLQPLLRSPLLLTMLAILHYNTPDRQLPDDRASIYDECVNLLLERWQLVRTIGVEGRMGLLGRLALPNLTLPLVREVLHRLAWQAHDRPPADDGRGHLDGAAVEGELLRFFRRLNSPNADASVQTFLTVVHEETGLLHALADDRYAFPHLTFQEYLAACALAEQTSINKTAYARWTSLDSDRWREVLLLLMGRLRQRGTKAVEQDALPWLKLLMSDKVGPTAKPATQRRKDAIFALYCYSELGFGAAFALSESGLHSADEVDAPLRRALLRVLHERDDAISFDDRMNAAQVQYDEETGTDARLPITIEQWREAWAMHNRRFGQPAGYWCYVRPGRYQIGGWNTWQTSAELALHEFWIAQFPITVAQFAPFVAAGYGNDAERWWAPQSWAWKTKKGRTQPWRWDEENYRWGNQALMGVTWHEATAYCAWLTEQLADALPTGYAIQLPTEAEWEAAAAFDATMTRHVYPWGDEEPTLAHAVYDAAMLQAPPMVGCCVAGRAACGAEELVGTVWEWTVGSLDERPVENQERMTGGQPKTYSVLRGHAYYGGSRNVRCGARDKFRLDNDDGIGFRVCISLRRRPVKGGRRR